MGFESPPPRFLSRIWKNAFTRTIFGSAFYCLIYGCGFSCFLDGHYDKKWGFESGRGKVESRRDLAECRGLSAEGLDHELLE